MSSILGALNITVTIANMRARGMGWARLPLFCWSMLAQAIMIILTLPVIAGAVTLLLTDRHFGTCFYDPSCGGSALLWQHLFWFFGHPEVYIMILPAFGVISEVLPVFARKPIFGYKAIAASSIAIAFLSMLVWAHHMFATPLSSAVLVFFMLSSMAIAVPTGVKVLNWVATLFRGSIALRTPLYFAAGFLVLFTLGGITGVMLAIFPIDRQVTDTYFVVAHFHFVLVAGSVSAVMAALYYWFPKITGRMLSERIGKLSFWLQFVGFLATFLIQHSLGLSGMPRRIYTYSADKGWGTDNLISTVGAFILAVGVLLTLANVLWGLRHGRVAGPDPWKGNTLEWFTTSPPPAAQLRRDPQGAIRRADEGHTRPDPGPRRGRNHAMSDTKLMVAIGILHLVALGAGGGLLLLAFRGGDGYDHPHAEGGRGPDQPPDPPRRPIGGPPLPSARPARVRLREPARLADLHAPAAAPRAARAERPDNQAERTRERRDSHAQDTAKPQETAAMFRRLLVAFDGSSHAQRALAEAVDMAQTNSGRLTVMTVVPEPSAWALGSGYEPAVDLNDLSRQIEREYQAMLDATVDTRAQRPPSQEGPHARTRRPGDRRRGEGQRPRPDRHGIARAR